VRFRCLPPTLVLAASFALSLPVAAAESAPATLTDKASAMLVRLGLLYRPPVAVQPAAPAPAPETDAAPAPAPEPASARIERVPPPPPDAYERLQQHGLLDAPPAAAPVNGEPAGVASTSVAAPEAAQAYSVLQRLGLLQTRPAAEPPSPVPAPVAPAATPDPEPPAVAVQLAATVPAASPAAPLDAAQHDVPPAAVAAAGATAPASLAASAVEKPSDLTRTLSEPLSRAYELLRAKGLLPGGPVNPAAKARPPLRNAGAERVLVDKSERKLFLFKGGRPYREFRISLGAMPVGPKQRAGDLRTPEGVYTLDWRNPRSR
jgi:hypothetical protein